MRAYFLKPETKRKNNIAESLFKGLAVCIKEIDKNYVSDRETKIKVGDIMPYQKIGEIRKLSIKSESKVRQAAFNNEFNFKEYFAIGENTETPTPETMPKGIAYCKSINSSGSFYYLEGNFYHIGEKKNNKPLRIEIFNEKNINRRCTQGDFLDHFIIPEEDHESEIDKQAKGLSKKDASCSESDGGSVESIEITSEGLQEIFKGKDIKIPEGLKISEEFKRKELYMCFKSLLIAFIEGKVYENQPQTLTKEELNEGYVAFISEGNKLSKFNPAIHSYHFKKL